MLRKVLLEYNPIPPLFNKLVSSVNFIANFSDYLRSLIFDVSTRPNLQKLLFLLGIGTLTFKIAATLFKTLSLWSWLPRHILDQGLLSATNLKKKYGEECYVAITGFTDGIGLAFAHVFAEYGFNLLLIGRNQQKVQNKIKQIRLNHKNVKIQYLVTDLSVPEQLNKLQTQLQRFAHLDIGIIVNNAGSVTGGPYVQSKPEDLLRDLTIDLNAIFNINRILLPKLRARESRSAILNISSCTGVYLSGRLGVYSSGKKSVDIYSRILEQENRDKIDIISVAPFGVTTKMMMMKKGPFMVNPRQCVKATLADLIGGKTTTFGAFKHKLSAALGFEPFTEEQRFKTYDGLWAAARQAQQN